MISCITNSLSKGSPIKFRIWYTLIALFIVSGSISFGLTMEILAGEGVVYDEDQALYIES
jgi:hypothetical protein